MPDELLVLEVACLGTVLFEWLWGMLRRGEDVLFSIPLIKML